MSHANDHARHGRHGFLRHLLKAAPILVVVTLLTAWLSEHGLLRGFESAALDVWLQLKAPRPVDDLVIVSIDDTDYRELWSRKSPLDRGVLQRLIDAVAAGGPRAVGVDLDTSDETYRDLVVPAGVPFVWAREGIPLAEPEEGGHGHEGMKFTPGPVLGREGAEVSPEIRSALALMPQDRDGVIRRYRQRIPVGGEGVAPGEMDTLGQGVVRAVPGHVEREADHHPLVLNFAGDRYAFPRIAARDVLAAAGSEGWRTAGPLKNKIVLIGGYYRAARDEYITPVGPMAGVQLVAQAIESELHGGGIRSMSHGLMTILEILSGVLLVWINYRFRLGTALLLSLVAMPLLTLTGSLIAFSSLAFYFNFVPSLVGVWIHELYDHAKEYRAMHEELHGGGRGHVGPPAPDARA